MRARSPVVPSRVMVGVSGSRSGCLEQSVNGRRPFNDENSISVGIKYCSYLKLDEMLFKLDLTVLKIVRSRCHQKLLPQVFIQTLSRNASSHSHTEALKKIRNIGILAHIDAGKTTTTERMLFFSGKINTMGEVHHGNTVTDYMEQERNRGITITSASASFTWKDHQINLVDTPGHIDFTMEVENALSIIDGCVVILDSSAGVEAQTQTVWRQADRKSIPRIVYANKMDRSDANIDLCVQTLQAKLGTEVFVTHLPIYGKEQRFAGIVDLLHLNKHLWEADSKGTDKCNITPLEKTSDGHLWELAVKSREDLIDRLSSYDDKLAEDIISQDSLENITAPMLSASLRRTTILCKGVPLLCGSSYKNKGVEPLMDAIVRYLPSPVERSNRIYSESFKNDFCAHAFKVLHHNHLGPVVFLRLYSGEISKKDRIFNMRLEIPEKCNSVMVATADDFEEVPVVSAGNIAVVSGLTETRAGDLVTSSSSAASAAYKNLAKMRGISDDEARTLLGVDVVPPESVFFCSIEAPSQSQQVALEKALARLQREDPSLSVTFNEETSQIVLGGMGELHLDIIKERLLTEYKLDIMLGPIQIAYREALNSPVQERSCIQETIGSAKQLVELDVTIAPKAHNDKDFIKFFSNDPPTLEKLKRLSGNKKILQAVKIGVKEGLKYGPKLHCPLMETSVTISDMIIGKGTSPTMITSAAAQCIRKALEKADTLLMEPIMLVEVVINDEHQSVVSADLSRRRAEILGMQDRHVNRVLEARVPLSDMLGYAKHLRYLTSGTATFSMEFQEYQALSVEQESIVIEKETGLGSY